jgi:beta-glucanase (GH16 family)
MMPKESKYGVWPKSGEIDIMEHVGHDTGKVHGTVHTQAYNHKHGTQAGGSMSTDVQEWHTYVVEWRHDKILFGIDNVVYHIFRKQSDANTDVWPLNQDFFLILNLAVGGTWGGQNGIDEDAFRGMAKRCKSIGLECIRKILSRLVPQNLQARRLKL